MDCKDCSITCLLLTVTLVYLPFYFILWHNIGTVAKSAQTCYSQMSESALCEAAQTRLAEQSPVSEERLGGLFIGWQHAEDKPRRRSAFGAREGIVACVKRRERVGRY